VATGQENAEEPWLPLEGNMMLSVDEALEVVLNATPVLSPARRRTVDAVGLTLDEDIISGEAVPSFDNSAVDGYAVRSVDLKNASKDSPVIFNVIDRVHAGTLSQKKLEDGEAIQIMTGAPIPDGADAVVMVELTEKIGGDTVKIFSPVRTRESIRFAGDDIQKDQTVLQKGHILRPYDLGLLASIGISDVRVIPKPKVAILSTGDELLEIHEPLTAGKIRSSNNLTLHALVRQLGAEPLDLGIARDTMEDTETKLRAAFSADIVLTSGGVSMGERDFVRSVLEKLGVEIKFWKVRQRPGKPLVFGVKNRQLFFGLPGNPVSAGVCFELYAAPAIAKMCGQPPEPIRVQAILEHSVAKKAGLRHFLRGRLKRTAQGYSVQTTGNQSSGILSSLAYANVLIDLPEEKENVSAGDPVQVIVLDNHALRG
jgi:molybdopterin molybdotransferase